MSTKSPMLQGIFTCTQWPKAQVRGHHLPRSRNDEVEAAHENSRSSISTKSPMLQGIFTCTPWPKAQVRGHRLPHSRNDKVEAAHEKSGRQSRRASLALQIHIHHALVPWAMSLILWMVSRLSVLTQRTLPGIVQSGIHMRA